MNPQNRLDDLTLIEFDPVFSARELVYSSSSTISWDDQFTTSDRTARRINSTTTSPKIRHRRTRSVSPTRQGPTPKEQIEPHRNTLPRHVSTLNRLAQPENQPPGNSTVKDDSFSMNPFLSETNPFYRRRDLLTPEDFTEPDTLCRRRDMLTPKDFPCYRIDSPIPPRDPTSTGNAGDPCGGTSIAQRHVSPDETHSFPPLRSGIPPTRPPLAREIAPPSPPPLLRDVGRQQDPPSWMPPSSFRHEHRHRTFPPIDPEPSHVSPIMPAPMTDIASTRDSINRLLPRTFSGNNDLRTSPVDFARNLEIVIHEFDVDIFNLKRLLCSILTGSAARWWRNTSFRFESSDELLQSFRSQFVSRNYEDNILFKIQSARQQRNELATKFIDRVTDLYDNLTHDESYHLIIRQLKFGLLPEYGMQMGGRTFYSVLDFRTEAERLDAFLYKPRPAPATAPRRPQVVCNGCGRAGHTQRECRSSNQGGYTPQRPPFSNQRQQYQQARQGNDRRGGRM